MKRIFAYILNGLGIVAAFCLVFTIIVVLIANDHDAKHELSEKWMHSISLILVLSIPALVVWVVFRLVRNKFFKKFRR